jgi:hypothetical protein
MSAARTLRNLAPAAFVHDATTLDLWTFMARYGDAPLLLIRMPEGDTELEIGLNGSAPNTGVGRTTIPKPLPFHTTSHGAASNQSRQVRESRREERVSLGQLMEKHAYFTVPVHKREDSDALFMGRVSVGRAHNKDIVLRHSSVSKFHAWFELDDSGVLHVSDADSTNLTQVNGRPIEPRARTAVHPGDWIRFGTVETLVCSPEAVWACLNPDKSSAASANWPIS